VKDAAATGTAEGDRAQSLRPTNAQLSYLAAVVNTSTDAIVSKALDGTITSWNLSAERMFGYLADEVIGRNIRLLIPAELHAEEDEILTSVRAGRDIEHYETVRVTKDGRRLDVSLSISPIKDEAGTVIGAAKIARDITARRQAEEQLIATTAKFESVFNQSAIFAGIMDLDGNLREANDLSVASCGYTREEVVDRPFWLTPWWRGAAEVQARQIPRQPGASADQATL
jgi:PAS domain S-box-containing protein